jgi:hypothetical protein
MAIATGFPVKIIGTPDAPALSPTGSAPWERLRPAPAAAIQ